MIVDTEVEIKISNRNISYYRNKGYLHLNIGKYSKIKVEDLPKNSSKIFVNVSCDYCEKMISKNFQALNRERNNSPIKKDCCKECRSIKVKESNFLIYGVESTNSLESTKKKRKNTNISKYGVENVMQVEEIKLKLRNVFLEKYNANTPSENNRVKEKIISTNKIRYGYKSPTLNEEIRLKQLNSMEQLYGKKYPMQVDEFKEKSKNTMYLNQTAPCSKQQRLIHNYIGGELNYPVGYYSLDIAYPKENIYVECDFSGHWLPLKLGKMSEEEWKKYELKRWYYLYRRNWKEIRIISKKDKIPSIEITNILIDFSKEKLKSTSSIKIDLDNSLIMTKDEFFDFESIIDNTSQKIL